MLILRFIHKNYRMRGIVTSLFLVFGILLPAKNIDSTRFYYVVQNPAFYGVENARAWFEISGIKDEKVQRKINDTLKKIFFEKTLFTLGSGGTTQGDTLLAGHTTYTYFNGQTFGDGWIRFKDSDSLLFLLEADGYYGGGMCLSGFWQHIAPGKLGFLSIDPTRKNGSQLTFSLVTGNIIPNTFYVKLRTDLRDSVERTLFTRAEGSINEVQNGLSNCRIIEPLPLTDSVMIGTSMLIKWYTNTMDENQGLIYRNYKMKCTNVKGDEIDWKTNSMIKFIEALYFLEPEEINRMKNYYKN